MSRLGDLKNNFTETEPSREEGLSDSFGVRIGRPPKGGEKRSARIALTLTSTEMISLKKKFGSMPLAIALRDHCEKTGFFPESNVEDDETDHLASGK
jgi:hypothetical protein|tara:strand:- start:220 stop:510 length:291 start_codon:yes stop_codon:yes gene_type:complete